MIIYINISNMNLDNAYEMWNDSRGNRWIKTSVDKTDQHFLNTVRKNWIEVNDDDILKAKKIVLNVFGDNAFVKGTPYSDFIHMFNSKYNYFVQTDINKEPILLKYEGECDMYINRGVKFEEMQMFI